MSTDQVTDDFAWRGGVYIDNTELNKAYAGSQARCFPSGQDLLRGVPAQAAAVMFIAAVTEDEHHRLVYRLLVDEEALRSAVRVTWEEAGKRREDCTTIASVLALLRREQRRPDTKVLELAAPEVFDSRPVGWSAKASLSWVPESTVSAVAQGLWLSSFPTQSLIFGAWDFRGVGAALATDDFRKDARALLRRVARLNWDGARQAVEVLEEQAENVAAVAATEHMLDEKSAGGPVLRGFNVMWSRPPANPDPDPDWYPLAERLGRWRPGLLQKVRRELTSDAFGTGLHSPRAKRAIVPLNVEDPKGIAGTLSAPEDNVEDRLDNSARLREVESIADPDERRLLAALAAAWLEDSSATFRDIARRNGWNPAVAEAVFKRFKRKAKKIS